MLSARDVHYDYNGRPALRGIDVDAAPGSLLGVIGPNGSGKSTLLKCLGGLIRPSQGRVLLQDRPLTSYRPEERARLIAGVPQDTQATLPFSCRDIVLMGRLPYRGRWGRPRRSDWELVEWAMGVVGCTHLQERRITELSGGERQMVVLAKALAQTPRLLLLDEPTQHLDLGHQIKWFDLLEHVARERGIAVVAALHEVNLAVEYCHELLLLMDGVAVSRGAVVDVAQAHHIQRAYGVEIVSTSNPQTGSPVFLPARLQRWSGSHGSPCE